MSIWSNLSPSGVPLSYHNVQAPYGHPPATNYTGNPPGSIPIVPPFTGTGFMGSIKNFLSAFPNSLAITHNK